MAFAKSTGAKSTGAKTTGAKTTGEDAVGPAPREVGTLGPALGNPGVLWGGGLLAVLVVIAALGPYFTVDPLAAHPVQRLKPPTAGVSFGPDLHGRAAFTSAPAGGRARLGGG